MNKVEQHVQTQIAMRARHKRHTMMLLLVGLQSTPIAESRASQFHPSSVATRINSNRELDWVVNYEVDCEDFEDDMTDDWYDRCRADCSNWAADPTKYKNDWTYDKCRNASLLDSAINDPTLVHDTESFSNHSKDTNIPIEPSREEVFPEPVVEESSIDASQDKPLSTYFNTSMLLSPFRMSLIFNVPDVDPTDAQSGNEYQFTSGDEHLLTEYTEMYLADRYQSELASSQENARVSVDLKILRSSRRGLRRRITASETSGSTPVAMEQWQRKAAQELIVVRTFKGQIHFHNVPRNQWISPVSSTLDELTKSAFQVPNGENFVEGLFMYSVLDESQQDTKDALLKFVSGVKLDILDEKSLNQDTEGGALMNRTLIVAVVAASGTAVIFVLVLGIWTTCARKRRDARWLVFNVPNRSKAQKKSRRSDIGNDDSNMVGVEGNIKHQGTTITASRSGGDSPPDNHNLVVIPGTADQKSYKDDDEDTLGSRRTLQELYKNSKMSSYFDDEGTFAPPSCIDDDRSTIAPPSVLTYDDRSVLGPGGFDDGLGSDAEDRNLCFSVVDVSSPDSTAIEGAQNTTSPRFENMWDELGSPRVR